MPLCLTAAAAGLLVGLAYILAQRRALQPSTLALVGLVLILLAQCTTPYFSPFVVGPASRPVIRHVRGRLVRISCHP
jgi:xanthosine utilization system XapX-like protein